MNTQSLYWVRYENGNWVDLLNLNLEDIGDTSGVYIIWHGGDNPKVVRVGQGNIKERLSEHRNNSSILKYRNGGNRLFVTWAEVSSSYQNGIEAYLAEKWSPLVGERFPAVSQIPVNSPWASSK